MKKNPMKKMQMAKKEHLDREVKKLEESLQSDEFLSGDDHESNMETSSDNADELLTNKSSDDEIDDFLSDAPDGNGDDLVESSSMEEDIEEHDDFLSDAPLDEKGENGNIELGLRDFTDIVSDESSFSEEPEENSIKEDNMIVVKEGEQVPDDFSLTPFDNVEVQSSSSIGDSQSPGLEGTVSSEQIPHKSSMSDLLRKYHK